MTGFADFEPYEVLSALESLWVAYRSTKDMHRCPYANGTGARKCLTGCYTEPHCITDCPDREGWGPEIHRIELLIAHDLEAAEPDYVAGGCCARHVDGPPFHPYAPQGLSFCHGCRRVVVRGKGRWWE